MGERGPQKQGREMGCMGAEDPSASRNQSSTMGATPARGFLAGVAGAGMALLASLSARLLLGLVSIPELTASLITAWLPPALFGALLVSLRYVARPLL